MAGLSRPRGFASRVAYMLWKDLLLDYRNPYGIATQAVFSVSAGVATAFASRYSPWPPEALLPPALLLASLFNAVYVAYYSFIREREQGTLEALQLVPGGAAAAYTAKYIYSAALIASFNLVYLASYTFFSSRAEPGALLGLASWALAASLYLAAVSSLTSAMLVYSSSYTGLAPLLVLVLSLPFMEPSAEVLASLASGYEPPGLWEARMAASGVAAAAIGGVLSVYVLE